MTIKMSTPASRQTKKQNKQSSVQSMVQAQLNAELDYTWTLEFAEDNVFSSATYLIKNGSNVTGHIVVNHNESDSKYSDSDAYTIILYDQAGTGIQKVGFMANPWAAGGIGALACYIALLVFDVMFYVE